MITLRTTSVDQTRALAAGLAPLARAGDLIVLAGDLGTGKTAFTQGFAAGLGVLEPVTSPTFTLVQTHDGRLPLHHVDVYRLERLAELADLALPELLDGEGVTVIEWGDVVATALPADYLEVRLAYPPGDPGENERRLDLRCVGRRWHARREALEAALEPWRC